MFERFPKLLNFEYWSCGLRLKDSLPCRVECVCGSGKKYDDSILEEKGLKGE